MSAHPAIDLYPQGRWAGSLALTWTFPDKPGCPGMLAQLSGGETVPQGAVGQPTDVL